MESRAKAFIFNFKRGIAAVTLDSHKKQSTCLPSSDDHFRSELSSFDDNFRAENGLELESIANTEIMNNPICSRDLEKEILELQSRLADTESKLVDTESKLADTESKLADTDSKLADTDSKLTDTESKLADTESKLVDMESKLADAEDKLNRSLFRLENIKSDDNLVKLYTGLPVYETLMAFYEELLQCDAKVMRQWRGRRSGCSYDVKAEPSHKLPLQEQFF